jgi:hypothetical protein
MDGIVFGKTIIPRHIHVTSTSCPAISDNTIVAPRPHHHRPWPIPVLAGRCSLPASNEHLQPGPGPAPRAYRPFRLIGMDGIASSGMAESKLFASRVPKDARFSCTSFGRMKD